MKPIIGICTNYSIDDGVGKKTGLGTLGQEWQLIANDYIISVERSGGIPVILPITENTENTFEILNKLDGIIFTGGSDIDPYYYDEYPKYGLGAINPKRDEHEIKLAKHVLEQTSLPVLGICRGIQLLTAATGGKMYQDLNREWKEGMNHTITKVPKHQPVHPVYIEEDSFFYQAFQEKEIGVNSFNHQAVKKLGKGFRTTMTAPDGLIEGIEYIGDRFVVAVQWHPEMMVDKHPQYLKLFSSYIQVCKEKREVVGNY